MWPFKATTYHDMKIGTINIVLKMTVRKVNGVVDMPVHDGESKGVVTLLDDGWVL
jgi:hypothetical protein